MQRIDGKILYGMQPPTLYNLLEDIVSKDSSSKPTPQMVDDILKETLLLSTRYSMY